MRKEASGWVEDWKCGDYCSPYELFLSLIKKREEEIKKTREAGAKEERKFIIAFMEEYRKQLDKDLHSFMAFGIEDALEALRQEFKRLKKLKGEGESER